MTTPSSAVKSSKALAKTWPYPRQQQYEDLLRKAATQWFTDRGLRTHPKYTYCLHAWTQWPQNIILPEVVDLYRAAEGAVPGA